MLRRLTARLDVELGIPRKSVRIFCNSRLPEKPLCVAAGLAWQGNNGLCITSGLGSLFVIAGAVIPASLSGFADPTPSPTHCGSCRRCIEACPTRAIRSPGIVDRSLCLQGLAASADALPPDVMEKWGARLYGCQVCQSVCPHNSGPLEEAPAADGEVGPSVSLRWFLSQDAPSLQRLFHGTTMGLSWISKEALLRNAIVAAGNSRYGGLRESVEPFVGNASPALNAAARWGARENLGQQRPDLVRRALLDSTACPREESQDHKDRHDDQQKEILRLSEGRQPDCSHIPI